MSDQGVFLSKRPHNWRIILAKEQLGHSYIFWAMPILIFSPFANFGNQSIVHTAVMNRFPVFPVFSATATCFLEYLHDSIFRLYIQRVRQKLVVTYKLSLQHIYWLSGLCKRWKPPPTFLWMYNLKIKYEMDSLFCFCLLLEAHAVAVRRDPLGSSTEHVHIIKSDSIKKLPFIDIDFFLKVTWFYRLIKAFKVVTILFKWPSDYL